jgi:hypothetical protein
MGRSMEMKERVVLLAVYETGRYGEPLQEPLQ